MVYCTSDLHGYPLRAFQRMLDGAGFGEDDFLYILGDVIDRNNDGGVETLVYLTRQTNAQLILGNHEAMLLSCGFLFEEVTDFSLEKLSGEEMHRLSNWLGNGAMPTVRALAELNRRAPEMLEGVLDYLREAPLYETVALPGHDFLLTHAGLGGFRPRKCLCDYSPEELLWHRPTPNERYFDDMFTVFGHTPTDYLGTSGRAFRTDTWIDIDTGAAGGAAPMLLRLDDMQEFYAE